MLVFKNLFTKFAAGLARLTCGPISLNCAFGCRETQGDSIRPPSSRFTLLDFLIKETENEEVGGSHRLHFTGSNCFLEVSAFQTCQKNPFSLTQTVMEQTERASDRERERQSWFLTFRCCRGSRVSDRSLVVSGNCYPPAQTCESECRREREIESDGERER